MTLLSLFPFSIQTLLTIAFSFVRTVETIEPFPMPGRQKRKGEQMDETPQKAAPANGAGNFTPSDNGGSPSSAPPSSLKKKRVRRSQPAAAATSEGTVKSLPKNSFHMVVLGKQNTSGVPMVVIVRPTGYLEHALTKPVYERNNMNFPTCGPWVETVECVKHVIKPIGADGNELTRPNDQYDPEKPSYYIKNGKRYKQPESWPVRALAFCVDEENSTDEVLLKWATDEKIPQFEVVPRFDKGKDNNLTVSLQADAIVHKEYWCDALSTMDIIACLNDEFDGVEEVQANIKAQPGFLYEIWPRGKLPMKVFTYYDLKQADVDASDWNNWVNHNRK